MKRMCKDCKAIDWCRHTFGKYWPAKSHGGVGCEVPLPDDAATLKRHFAAIPTPDPF